MASQIQIRRDTLSAWSAANPVLLAGEIGFATDSLAFKIGDGATAWNSLGWYEAKQRGCKVGLEVYYSASDDVRVRPGFIDVNGTILDITSETLLTGESGYSAAWQYVTINTAGTIQLRAATGPNTARPTDSYFQWGEYSGSGFNHSKNGYYYSSTERIIGALWRTNATSWLFINLGSGCEEVGQNANGSYRKLSDGTLFVWGLSVQASLALSTAYLGGFRNTGASWQQTSPHASTDGTFQSCEMAADANLDVIPGSISASANVFSIFGAAVTSQSAATRHAYFFAVGRWKA